jgi:hypothetical protein
VIAEIRSHDPHQADVLTRLANNFAYDEILALIDKTEHRS